MSSDGAPRANEIGAMAGHDTEMPTDGARSIGVDGIAARTASVAHPEAGVRSALRRATGGLRAPARSRHACAAGSLGTQAYARRRDGAAPEDRPVPSRV